MLVRLDIEVHCIVCDIYLASLSLGGLQVHTKWLNEANLSSLNNVKWESSRLFAVKPFYFVTAASKIHLECAGSHSYGLSDDIKKQMMGLVKAKKAACNIAKPSGFQKDRVQFSRVQDAIL